MTKFIDITARDMQGAATQFKQFITGDLGYDDDIMVQISAKSGGKFEIYLRGEDAFQRRSQYGERVGVLFVLEVFTGEDDWDKGCGLVWEKLKKAMQRDERELRYGLKAMGGIVEQAPSFTSLVGKMFADRIKAARDEATNHMIEHHGWQAAE